VSPATVNDRDQAIRATREWLAIRLEVRKFLIDAARDAHPIKRRDEDWESNSVRKLYQYPNDLSEQRLLSLIEGE